MKVRREVRARSRIRRSSRGVDVSFLNMSSGEVGTEYVPLEASCLMKGFAGCELLVTVILSV